MKNDLVMSFCGVFCVSLSVNKSKGYSSEVVLTLDGSGTSCYLNLHLSNHCRHVTCAFTNSPERGSVVEDRLAPKDQTRRSPQCTRF